MCADWLISSATQSSVILKTSSVARLFCVFFVLVFLFGGGVFCFFLRGFVCLFVLFCCYCCCCCCCCFFFFFLVSFFSSFFPPRFLFLFLFLFVCYCCCCCCSRLSSTLSGGFHEAGFCGTGVVASDFSATQLACELFFVKENVFYRQLLINEFPFQATMVCVDMRRI